MTDAAREAMRYLIEDGVASRTETMAFIRALEAGYDELKARLAEADRLAALVVEDHRVGTAGYSKTQAFARSFLSRDPGGREKVSGAQAPESATGPSSRAADAANPAGSQPHVAPKPDSLSGEGADSGHTNGAGSAQGHDRREAGDSRRKPRRRANAEDQEDGT